MSASRPRQTDCKFEPPYPGLGTVLLSFSSPDVTGHLPTDKCSIQEPHSVEECGEYNLEEPVTYALQFGRAGERPALVLEGDIHEPRHPWIAKEGTFKVVAVGPRMEGVVAVGEVIHLCELPDAGGKRGPDTDRSRQS